MDSRQLLHGSGFGAARQGCRPMSVAQRLQPGVSCQAVGKDVASLFDGLTDELVELLARSIGERGQANSANGRSRMLRGNGHQVLTLAQAGAPGPWLRAADDGLVDFHVSLKQGPTW